MQRIGNTLKHTGISNNFIILIAQFRERIDKWDHIELKSFCTAKKIVARLKTPPTEW
jgi:hypothetical protein